jgi:ATP-binding cassette subfamily F protein uup
MDNVVTSIIVMDGQGGVEERVGSYSDWEAAGGHLTAPCDAAPDAGRAKEPAVGAGVPAAKKPDPVAPAKLSYKDQRELDALPGIIEKLEQQQARMAEQMAEPGFFAAEPDTVRDLTNQFNDIQSRLGAAYARWSALEDR